MTGVQTCALPISLSQFIVNATDWFKVFWWVLILAVAAIIIGIRYFVSTSFGRYQWDQLKVNLPIFGDIFQKIYMARFSRNLATLVSGGIPIIQAIRIVADTLSNVVYRDMLLDTAVQVTNGKSISESLQNHKEFPVLVTQMVRVGEQTAQLDTILQKLAEFYEKEVDAKVATLATLLEPLIMIILGVGVGLLVAGILMPIYNLASTAG